MNVKTAVATAALALSVTAATMSAAPAQASAPAVTGTVTLAKSAEAAQAGGCVTLAEARRTFKNRTQTRNQIDRGLGTKGVRVDKMGNTELRSYKPCRRTDATYVAVVYVKQRGAWRTIFWVYSLARGGALQTAQWESDTK